MELTDPNLAKRVLEKIGVLAAGEPMAAADLQKVREKLQAAHAAVQARNLDRWTEKRLPSATIEPYVSLAAVLVAPDFGRQAGPDWWMWGMSEMAIVAAAAVAQGPIPAEYF